VCVDRRELSDLLRRPQPAQGRAGFRQGAGRRQDRGSAGGARAAVTLHRPECRRLQRRSGACVVLLALVLAALALELGLLAFGIGGPGWILLWPAVAFLIVALAYLTQSSVPFGKVGVEFRAGRRILLLPYLATVTVIWHVLRLVERRAPWNQLNQGFFIGRRLLRHEYPPGIASVVDLTCELPAITPAGEPVKYFNFPILDAGCPSPTELHANVKAILSLPRPVYVHCAQGHGRTGLVAAAILLAEGHAKTVGEALGQTVAARPGVHVNRRQRLVLEQSAQTLTSNDAAAL